MSEMKTIGITAIVSAGLATLLLVGMLVPMLGIHLIHQQKNYSFTVYSGNNHTIDAAFVSGERWVISYSSTYSISAYLLDEADFQDYLYNGFINHYINYRSGSSGSLDYTVSNGGHYYVLFTSSSTASVSVTTTEYHFS
ncbi:MAG: hypothetical protein Q6365_017400 [Candidatus Sigynarchaeota archaeon]